MDLEAQLRVEVMAAAGDAATAGGWDRRQRALAVAIAQQDAREFLRWHAIRRIRIHSRRQWEARWLLAGLRARPDWATRWAAAVEESDAGRPERLRSYPRASANSILHADHVARWEMASRCRLSDLPLIVEIGGGYGGLCRIAHALGFRGRYVIYDLSVMSALQRYYLQRSGLSLDRILCLSDVDALRSVLEAGASRALLCATWSLSELPLATRDRLAPLWPAFTDFLLAYQWRFAGIDNRRWFRELVADPRLAHVSWAQESMRTQPFNYRLFGFPRLRQDQFRGDT